MIRACEQSDINDMYDIINDAAQAYRGIIPEDRWHEPYMQKSELQHEIDDGVCFWGYEDDGELIGVMGIQDKGDVALIRHAYVRTERRKQGVGTKLLHYLEYCSTKPILIGTWADAVWAIHFYQNNTRQRVTFEYVMIKGINDSDEHAKMLIKLLKGLMCHVNLIEHNPYPK